MKSRVLPAKIAIVATAAATAAGIIGMVTPAHAQAQITRVWTENARYLPNQSVDVTAQVTGASHVRFRLMHLGEQVMASDDRPVDGYGRASWEFSAPDRDYTGYVIEADSDNGAQGETALDVSSDPYRYLRFGFLDSYPEGMSGEDQQRAVDDLAQKYHINALQFYDWMYRHEAPVPYDGNGVAPTWSSWGGETMSRDTITGLIHAAQWRSVEAYPYSMSYAALNGYESYGVSPNWRLTYRSSGTPWSFEMLANRPDSTLWIMDPSNPAWRSHIVSQYVHQSEDIGFDGTHLDQLGDWGHSEDHQGGMATTGGVPVDLPKAFGTLIDQTADATGKPVGMNAVDGFGMDHMAAGSATYEYTEMWDSHERYEDVQNYLQQQRILSGNKPAVVAGYVNNKWNNGPGYEAEASTATRTGVQVATDHRDYSGTGFIDHFGERGDSVTFRVHVDASRNYGLVPRWSNATGDMAARTFSVDGRVVSRNVLLGLTQDWDHWNIEGGTWAYLTEGDHSVTISVDEGDYGYINLDELHINSFSTPSVQLFDAALAANGASHIEMGQGDRMIAAAYFPDRTKWMDEELTQWITRYYDVTTGYEELFYGPTLRPLDDSIVEIPGYNVSRNGLKNTIYARVMRSGGMDVIHLINLLGNDEFWRDPGNAVSDTGSFTVRYHYGDSPTPGTVYKVTPDTERGTRAVALPSRLGTDETGNYVDIDVDNLHAWDVLYMGQNTTGNGNVVNQGQKCMDVREGASANGTPIQLYDCASVPAQRVTYDGNTLSVMGKCVDLEYQGTENGTYTHLWDCNGAPSQTWYYTPRNQYYNPHSGKCLTLDGDHYTNGNRLTVWDCHGGASQKWSKPQ